MRIILFVFILIVLLLDFQIATGAENEYGTVKAWFNGENATVNGVELKVGEPAEVKVEVVSKINGHVFVELTEPGATKAFDVIGPSKQDESIDNYDITTGWSKTYKWTITPSGEWKNGNAPINIFVSFYNIKKDFQKPIQFSIANPYILDEQYTGAATTKTPAPEIAGTGAPPAKAAPFPSGIFVFMALLVAWRFRRGTRA